MLRDPLGLFKNMFHSLSFTVYVGLSLLVVHILNAYSGFLLSQVDIESNI